MTSVKDVDDILQSSLFDETTTYYCSIWQAKITDFLPENQISTTTDILRVYAKSQKCIYQTDIQNQKPHLSKWETGS